MQIADNVIKILRELIFTGYFLDKNQEEYCNFYEKLLDTDCTRFHFYILRFQEDRYHFTYWWDPLSNFYEQYVQDVYHVSPEVTNEYQILAENNKFFFRWAMSFNYRLHKMSVYKDESLEEVREIYRGLGLIGRVYMSDSLLDVLKSNTVLSDWMLHKDREKDLCEESLIKLHLDNTYMLYADHNQGLSLRSDWDFDFVTTNLFDFEHLVFQNTYGDVTAPIHPDYNKKERSISFLSSIRLASERYPRALTYCVYPNVGISVVNMGFDTSELREIYRIADECKKEEIKNANKI